MAIINKKVCFPIKIWIPLKSINTPKNIGDRHPGEKDCVAIPFWSLRATKGSVAISKVAMTYEIASVVSLPRNDIMTQSVWGRLFAKGNLIPEIL